jgi:hypothetical protein
MPNKSNQVDTEVQIKKAEIQEERITVHNPISPNHVTTVDAQKYLAMKKALLKVLPKKAPGFTQSQMLDAILPHLPDSHFPGGDKAGWWMKCVQLDLEFHTIIVREESKPLRWHQT